MPWDLLSPQYLKNCHVVTFYCRDRGAVSSKQLKFQLQQAQQLSENYREQCISMEEKLCKLKEERDASKGLFQQRTEKLTKRLELMNSRYQSLEKRRVLEIDGYKSDIKLLRQRLKEVEKQLYKVHTYYVIRFNYSLVDGPKGLKLSLMRRS